VAREVKKALERDVKELKMKRLRIAARGQAERVVEAYEARAVSNVLAGNKARLLQGLPGKQLEGVRDYVETVFPPAELPNTFRAGATTYVERREAEALLAKAVEVVGVLDIGEDKVKLNIISTPNDAIFKLVSASGITETTCTKPCSITVPRGDYTYEITRKGYQPTKNSLPLMHKKPYVNLECELVREGEEKDPTPCRIEENQ
jgi:hypothetical protein